MAEKQPLLLVFECQFSSTLTLKKLRSSHGYTINVKTLMICTYMKSNRKKNSLRISLKTPFKHFFHLRTFIKWGHFYLSLVVIQISFSIRSNCIFDWLLEKDSSGSSVDGEYPWNWFQVEVNRTLETDE